MKCVSLASGLYIYNPGKNISRKIKESSKIGQDQKILIFVFAYFLSASANIFFPQGRLDTKKTMSSCSFEFILLFFNYSILKKNS